MFKTKSSLFFTRFKLYLFGLGLGLVLSYGFFHERYPTWLPGSVILEELNACEITYSDKAICLMNCSNISKQAIGEILAEGEVIFSKAKFTPSPAHRTYLKERRRVEDF